VGKFVKQSHGVPFNINNFVCPTEQAVTKKQTSKMGYAFFCLFFFFVFKNQNPWIQQFINRDILPKRMEVFSPQILLMVWNGWAVDSILARKLNQLSR